MPAPAPTRKSTTKTLSLEEQIRQRAYELYLQRGNQSGSEFDDWLQAEEECFKQKIISLARSNKDLDGTNLLSFARKLIIQNCPDLRGEGSLAPKRIAG